MSYITSIGTDVDSSIEQSEKDFSKALVSFKSGTSLKVRLLGLLDRAEYYSHSVFKVFYTTVHTPEDLYCKARKICFNEANQLEDGDKKEAILKMAKDLKPQPRYLFGFGILEGENAGKQIVVDLTKAQAKIVIAGINKNANKIAKKAFELEKTGSSTNTVVSFSPLDLDDLTSDELKHFESFEGQTFDKEVFGNIFSVNTEQQQLQDLQKLGFDITKLTGGSSQSASEERKEEYDF